jgi:hypothetical protein
MQNSESRIVGGVPATMNSTKHQVSFCCLDYENINNLQSIKKCPISKNQFFLLHNFDGAIQKKNNFITLFASLHHLILKI